jgi:GLPGLI family protein
MRLLLLLLALTLAHSLIAQNLTVTYIETRNVDAQLSQIPDPTLRAKLKNDLSKPEYFKLQIQQPLSLYVKAPKAEQTTEKKATTQSNVQVMEFKSEAGMVFKNYAENVYLQDISLLGKSFLIKDSIPVYDWAIQPEEIKVGELICKKAVATVNGEEITVWYTEEIPISAGPGKLGGLPGLILKAKTANKDYEAVELLDTKESATLNQPQGKDVVTFKEYEKIRSEKVNQLQSGKW